MQKKRQELAKAENKNDINTQDSNYNIKYNKGLKITYQ